VPYSNKETRGHVGHSNGCTKSLYFFSYTQFHNKSNINSLTSIDYEGFSAWRVDFKYNNELTQIFMSSNQIGRIFNRLEASRKYLFGSVGVLGTSGNSVISGALLSSGQK